MKKYFFGLIAVVAAITFSAFRSASFQSPLDYLLTSDPSSSGIVDPGTSATTSTWNITGFLQGNCLGGPEDLACKIQLDMSTMGAFTHQVGGVDELNTRAYAISQGVGTRYLEIQESFANPRYKINTILAKQIVNVGGTLTDAPDNTPVIQKASAISTGVDVAYENAKYQ